MNVQIGKSNATLGAAVAEVHERYIKARPKSAALHARAQQVMPGGNTRTVLSYRPFPTAMTRGEGCRLWDLDGHEYVDLCGEYTAGLFGHSEGRIHDAIRAALHRGLSLAAVGEGEEALARRICDRFASIELVRFTNSGTEANLMAITAARAFTSRPKIIVFKGGYHGGVLTFSVSGPSRATAPFPVLTLDYNDIAGACEAIRVNARDLAAVIVEPMMGGGGCIPADVEFLKALRSATEEAGVLLIFDEVMTSRMSDGGVQKRIGITPDLTALGKYLGGGMSFGAFGGRREVMQVFAADLPHAGTFNNNVLSMAAGNVALQEIFTADVSDRLFRSGEDLRQRLNAECRRAGASMHFTGMGSLATPHFRHGPVERPYVPTPAEDLLRELFFFDILQAGVYIARRGMTALSLPVTTVEHDLYVKAVAEFIQSRGSLLESASSNSEV